MDQKYEVKLTKRADEDLSGIIHYLMTTYSPASAEKAVAAIHEQLGILKKYPESKPIFEDRSETEDIVYRYAIAGKVHRLVFTIEKVEGVVAVIRIVHVKADKTRILKEIEEE